MEVEEKDEKLVLKYLKTIDSGELVMRVIKILPLSGRGYWKLYFRICFCLRYNREIR